MIIYIYEYYLASAACLVNFSYSGSDKHDEAAKGQESAQNSRLDMCASIMCGLLSIKIA